MRLIPLFALVLTASLGARAQDVRDAFPGLAFSRPVGLAVAPGQPDRVFVVEKEGRVRVATPGVTTAAVFLDLRSRVDPAGEGGLLGLAFHPDYGANGRLFVHYTAPVAVQQPGVRVMVSRVSEFARSAADPLAADPASERVVLEVDQPADNHNGGALAFGPDGRLYIALGDGGGAGDPYGNGQDPTTLLGSVLRIDVDDVPDGAAYGIPEDNPFAPTDGLERDEIYAYGFRNPWKFSFDPASGALWLGDVGQGEWEEVDVVVNGGNYGWDQVEGPECYRAGCDLGLYRAPAFAYRHGEGTGRSVTGGFVYRGSRLPDLVGRYLYADFVSGRVWALDTTGVAPTSTLLTERYDGRKANLSALDRGPDGEPYAVDYGSGRIFQIVPSTTSASPEPEGAPVLRVVGPNPFRGGTEVEVSAAPGHAVRVVVVDGLGREVAVLHDGPAPSGTLRLRLDGWGLASGLHVVRLAAGEDVRSVTVVRVR